jgi:hypothetical protein
MAVNEFSMDAINARRRASANLAGTAGVAPDQAANVIRMAPQAGIPPSVGMHTPSLVEEASTGRIQQDTLRDNPFLAEWVANADPSHVAAAKDDLPGLAAIGRVVGGTFGAIGTGMAESAYGAAQMLNEPFQPLFNKLGIDTGAKARREMAAVRKEVTPEFDNPIARGILSGAISLGTQIPWYIAAVLGRNPAIALGGMSASVAGQEYGQARDAGKSVLQSQVYGLGQGAIEAITEKIPVGALIGDIEKGTGFGKTLLKQIALELPTEQAATILQDLNDWANKVSNPDATFADYLAERPNAALETAVATVVAAGGLTSISSLADRVVNGRVPAVGVDPLLDALRASAAQLDVDSVARIQEQLAASPTFTRSPEVVEGMLSQTVSGQMVEVDADVLAELEAAGVTPFGSVEENAITGEPLSVPLSQYLAATAGQTFAQQLNAATTFREDGVSLDQAAEVVVPVLREPREPAPIDSDFTPEEADHARTLAAAHTEAVVEVVQAMRLNELFTDNKAIGMSKEQFERYNLGIENAIDKAVERMTRRAMTAVRQERSPAFQEALAQNTAAVEQAYATNPLVIARAELGRGRGPLNEELATPLKLDREDAIAAYGSDLGLPSRYFSKNGVPADVAAEKFGFASGAEMMRELAALNEAQGELTIAQHQAATIKEQALAATREQLGYDITPQAIYEAASAAISVPAISDFLASELQVLAKQAGLPFDKATLKAEAAARFSELSVANARNLKRLEKLVYKSGEATERALLKGDIPAAFKHKQRQYRHMLQLQMAHKFTQVYNKVGKKVSRWSKQKSSKTIAPEYFNRVLETLARGGVPLRRDATDLAEAIGTVPLDQWVLEKQNEGQPISYSGVVKPIPDMTVEEFGDWTAMLISTAKNGAVEADPVVQGWITKAVELAKQLDFVSEGNVATAWAGGFTGKTASFARGLDALNTGFEDTFDYLDGGDPNGPHNEIFKMLTRAANRYDQLAADIYSPISQMYDKLPKKIRKTYKNKIINTTFINPRTGDYMPLRRGDLLPILLNMGTENNILKLAEGYKTSPQAILDFVNLHITKEEAAWAQFVWDQMTDKLFPIANANARETQGYGMRKEQAIPVKLKVGTLKGGYYPLSYNNAISAPEAVPVKAAPIAVHPFRIITTPSGFEQTRTSYVAPIDLNLDTVLRDHLNEVFTRIAYGTTIPRVMRFFSDSRIQLLWDDKAGRELYRQIRPWIDKMVMDAGAPDAGNRALATLRQRATVGALGAKLSVVWAQLLGLPLIASEIGWRWTLDGYRHFYYLAVTNKLNDMYALMPELKWRHMNLEAGMRDMKRRVHSMNYNTTTPEQFIEHASNAGMHIITLADKYLVSGGAAAGAFRKAKNEMGMTDAQAAEYAEKIVRKTQGSGRVKDVVPFQATTNEFQRMATWMYTPIARIYNLQKAAVSDLRIGYGLQRPAGKAAEQPLTDKQRAAYRKRGRRRALNLFILLPILEAAREGIWPDEDEQENPIKWFGMMLRKIALGAVGRAAWSRDIAAGVDRYAEGERPWPASNAYTAFVNSQTGIFKPDNKRWVKAWFDFLGMWGVVPVYGATGNVAQFGYDLATGTAKPKNPGDWYEGLTKGRINKDN